ncbi:MAG TPA: septal ring lytic transglycosylase RlpA family protein [Longimicrobiales bacterium]|nr:septal ring lytic transglycosylase RlpA family protein [Longimicrobiales bacterium]
MRLLPVPVLLVPAILAASGCTVVGYPAGAPEVPAPVAGAPGTARAGRGTTDREEPASGAGPELPPTPPSEDLPEDDLDAIPDAVPREEPLSRYGNPGEYEVFGETYRVLDSSEGYVAEGLASWYGEEFQGKRTSSGETYDMYLMTAAHRTLPIPTYVEVTNLENGRVVVVRVNDRGPFHPDRVIDLSYVAARKLGIVGAGTARVRVRALEPAARQATGG